MAVGRRARASALAEEPPRKLRSADGYSGHPVGRARHTAIPDTSRSAHCELGKASVGRVEHEVVCVMPDRACVTPVPSATAQVCYGAAKAT
ncbi:hypothetical protein GCM10010402_87450 [Actinomadura luteofluorescens]